MSRSAALPPLSITGIRTKAIGTVGGIGFFECINNQAAADKLFTQAQAWLTENGMTAMDGPINFGERDKWWGLVVQGFQPPLYCMNYNQPYYRELFENYGFQPFYQQICFGMHPREPFQKKLFDRHANIAKDPDFSARYMSKKTSTNMPPIFARFITRPGQNMRAIKS
ncbi:MAG: hypothetical protein QM664_00770 [Flavihumibacter sp.]